MWRQLDSAISYVRSNTTYKIYQIEGHDEAVTDTTNFGSDSNLKDIVSKYNAEIESIKLVNRTEITTDECAALLILGPKKDYTEYEAKIVINYLNNGGKAIIGLENLTSQGVTSQTLILFLKSLALMFSQV